jgi:hypothetical protein
MKQKRIDPWGAFRTYALFEAWVNDGLGFFAPEELAPLWKKVIEGGDELYKAACKTLQDIIEAKSKKGRWEILLRLREVDGVLHIERRGPVLTFWAAEGTFETLKGALESIVEAEVGRTPEKTWFTSGELVLRAKQRVALSLQHAIARKKL